MKRFMVLASMLLMASLVFGGGEQARGGVQKTIAFWSSHTPPDSDTLKAIVDGYNATSPAAKVEMVTVPGAQTEITKLMTAVRGGTGPDVYMLDRFTIAQRAADGLLEDITDYLKKLDPNIQSHYMEFAWAETQWKGRTYGLPFDTDARAFYYRKDMIREAGYDIAIFDPKNGPLSIDKVKEIAFKINKTDTQGNYTQVGLIPSDHFYSQGNPYTWGFVFGGQFVDFKAGKVTPLDAGVVAAFQFIYDWAKDMDPQKVQTFISTYSPPNNPPAQNPFLTKKVAMAPHGDWFINTLRTYAPDVEYGVTYLPVPKTGQGPVTFAGGWSYVVPKGSKNIDGAVRFVQWACGENGQRLYTKGTAHLPTYKSLHSEDIFSPQHVFFKDYIAYARSRPVLPIGALYYDSLYRAYDKCALNVITPQEGLKTVEEELQPELAKFLPLQ
jgi:multiple sugar transport system substrate-binding protein